jgi:hypothetical protein
MMESMDLMPESETEVLADFFLNGKQNVCEVCGNTYDKCFGVQMNGELHVFDSFECAIQALAPRCAHCDCRVIGHGVEADDVIYCCANCARQHGIHELEDRVEAAGTP